MYILISCALKHNSAMLNMYIVRSLFTGDSCVVYRQYTYINMYSICNGACFLFNQKFRLIPPVDWCYDVIRTIRITERFIMSLTFFKNQ